MNYITREIDSVGTLIDDIPLNIDFYEVRCSDFVIAQTKLVDQKLVMGSRNTARYMVVNQIAHTEMVCQSVGSGKVYSGLPFFR